MLALSSPSSMQSSSSARNGVRLPSLRVAWRQRGLSREEKGGMMVPQAVSTTILVGLLAGGVQADQVETPLQGGAYQITVRVELPNVENWAAQKTTTNGLPIAGGTRNDPFPVLSDNNPLAN